MDKVRKILRDTENKGKNSVLYDGNVKSKKLFTFWFTDKHRAFGPKDEGLKC